jgi:hypothetical protein
MKSTFAIAITPLVFVRGLYRFRRFALGVGTPPKVPLAIGAITHVLYETAPSFAAVGQPPGPLSADVTSWNTSMQFNCRWSRRLEIE